MRKGLCAIVLMIASCIMGANAQADSCLTGAGPLIQITGKQAVPYDKRASVGDGTRVNAQGALWQDAGSYPVQIGAGNGICFSGATVIGTYPPSTTWDVMHSTAALYIQGPSLTVENYTVRDYGDGIRIRAGSDGFVIQNAHFSYIRDDCIENDFMSGGLVSHSLLDGCYNAFSAQTGGSNVPPDGSAKTWRIQNSLIRLQAMEQAYGGKTGAHAGFFKWDKGTTSKSPKLALVNNIFRADQNSDTVGLAIPPDKLIECSNNTMVWLGPGSYPEQLPATLNNHPCITITRDQSVWDSAVAQWAPNVTPTTSPLCPKFSQGDANCDGMVNLVDFEIFRTEFSKQAQTARADFNRDASVTIVDFEIWRRGYTTI